MDQSDRIKELTRELMAKGLLIDQLSEQVEQLEKRQTSPLPPDVPSTTTINHMLHEKTHLVNSLSHSLLTVRRVLNLEKDAHGFISNSLHKFFEGFSSDIKLLVSGVSKFQRDLEAAEEKKEGQLRDEASLAREDCNRYRSMSESLSRKNDSLRGDLLSMQDEKSTKAVQFLELNAKVKQLEEAMREKKAMKEEMENGRQELHRLLEREKEKRVEAEAKRQEVSVIY